MDLTSRCLICLITPITFYIAQSNHLLMLTTLSLANPFTVVLLIWFLNSLSTVPTTNKMKTKVPKHNDNALLEISEKFHCCDFTEDRIYIYYRLWASSTHIILLWTIQCNLVSSLQISCTELTLLYGSYFILLGLILNIRHQISIATQPINARTRLSGTRVSFVITLTICGQWNIFVYTLWHLGWTRNSLPILLLQCILMLALIARIRRCDEQF